MPLDVIWVGDENIQFVATFIDQDEDVIDVSAATAMYIRFEKPDGTATSKTGAFFTDGTDGKVEYYSAAGLFVSADVGLWRWQGHVEMPTGKFKTREASFMLSEF